MGTKRVGLARTQALIEGLKRSLNLGTASITAKTLAATEEISGKGNFKVDKSGYKTGVEGVSHSAAISATSGTTWSSGAMTIPAHAIITDVGVVVTTQLEYAGSSTVGFKAGDAAGEADIVASLAANLVGSSANCAVGRGVSTNPETLAALTGVAVGVMAVGAAYAASAREIHATLTSTGAITAGTVRFWVKYIHVEG